MFKLIKLEIKKCNIKGYIKSAIITTSAIMVLIFSISITESNEGTEAFANFNELISVADTLVRNIYIIFASVLLSKFIIDEYKNKTISLMFMYPIKRKKILLSKLIIVVLFTFFVIIISDIIIVLLNYIINYFGHFVSIDIVISDLLIQILNILINAFTTAFIILIPLFFGMRKKSVPTTIVSSIIMVAIIGSNNGRTSLSSNIYVSLFLALIGVLIAYLSIKNIEHEDVL